MKLRITYTEVRKPDDITTKEIFTTESKYLTVALHNKANIEAIYTYPDEQIVDLKTLPDRIDAEKWSNGTSVDVHIIGELQHSVWKNISPICWHSDGVSRVVMCKGEYNAERVIAKK